ncbi:MAG: HlyD family efflux transporter periplasmic adaptor subunit, partial [Eubacterium sp.]
SGDLSNLLLSASKENSKLTDENLNTIKDIIYDFTNNFDNMNFSDLYSFKSTIRGTVVDLINMNSLEKLAKDNGESFSINKAEVSGIVLYRVDDFETIKPKKLKNSDYDKSEYIAALFSSGDKITKGAPIYKAINDDEWSIALKFNKKDVKKYKDTTNIVIKFLKDGLSTTANLKIVKGADGNSYGVVTLSKYLSICN